MPSVISLRSYGRHDICWRAGSAMALALAAICCVVRPASAVMVELVSITPAEVVPVEHHGQQENAFAGVFNLLLDTEPFRGFCASLESSVSILPYEATLEPLSILNGGLQAGYLYQEYAAQVNDDHHAAALQLAIWEVVEDWGTELDFSAGDFRVIGSEDLVNTATDYLDTIPKVITDPPGAVVVHSDTYQDLLVPEPAVWSVFLLTGLLWLRKRS